VDVALVPPRKEVVSSPSSKLRFSLTLVRLSLSLLLMRFRVLLTEPLLPYSSLPKRFKTGTRRIYLRMSVSLSTLGLPVTRKSLRLSFS